MASFLRGFAKGALRKSNENFNAAAEQRKADAASVRKLIESRATYMMGEADNYTKAAANQKLLYNQVSAASPLGTSQDTVKYYSDIYGNVPDAITAMSSGKGFEGEYSDMGSILGGQAETAMGNVDKLTGRLAQPDTDQGGSWTDMFGTKSASANPTVPLATAQATPGYVDAPTPIAPIAPNQTGSVTLPNKTAIARDSELRKGYRDLILHKDTNPLVRLNLQAIEEYWSSDPEQAARAAAYAANPMPEANRLEMNDMRSHLAFSYGGDVRDVGGQMVFSSIDSDRLVEATEVLVEMERLYLSDVRDGSGFKGSATYLTQAQNNLKKDAKDTDASLNKVQAFAKSNKVLDDTDEYMFEDDDGKVTPIPGSLLNRYLNEYLRGAGKANPKLAMLKTLKEGSPQEVMIANALADFVNGELPSAGDQAAQAMGITAKGEDPESRVNMSGFKPRDDVEYKEPVVEPDMTVGQIAEKYRIIGRVGLQPGGSSTLLTSPSGSAARFNEQRLTQIFIIAEQEGEFDGKAAAAARSMGANEEQILKLRREFEISYGS